MPSDVEEKQEQQEINPVEQLRNEFQAQFATLKASFDDELKTLKSENDSLKAQNSDLQRALIRSATVPQPEVVKEKTEEELYNEKIKLYAEKALSMIEGI